MKFQIGHLIILVFIVSCTKQEDSKVLVDEVLTADRNFSTMSSEKGIAAAFLHYADERVIKPQPGKQPVVGKYELMQFYKNNPVDSTVKLTWEPLRGEASGILGYTFGSYTLKRKTADGLRDTVLYGNYVSIWKKKKDGSWRYIIDTGNETPGPVTLQ